MDSILIRFNISIPASWGKSAFPIIYYFGFIGECWHNKQKKISSRECVQSSELYLSINVKPLNVFIIHINRVITHYHQHYAVVSLNHGGVERFSSLNKDGYEQVLTDNSDRMEKYTKKSVHTSVSHRQAVDFYSRKLKDNPAMPRYNHLMAALKIKEKDLDGAVSLYKAAIEHGPENVMPRNDYALFLAKKGDREGGIKEMRAAIEIQSESALLRNNMVS